MKKKLTYYVMFAVLFFSICSNVFAQKSDSEIYNFVVKNQSGEDVKLSDYEGEVLLIVNTAIKCGFTPQYKDLQALYSEFKDAGFCILDFPCNQFLGQAPGTDAEINTFCETRFGITFPQFSKIDVNGENAIPLYKWLVQNTGGKKIKWNFTKFLIDRNGNIIKRYESATAIKNIKADVESLL